MSNLSFGVTTGRTEDWLGFLRLLPEQYRHIEFRVLEAEPHAKVLVPSYLHDVRVRCEDYGATCSMHAVPGINLSEKVARLRRVSTDILTETVHAAHGLGAKWVTVHLGSCGFQGQWAKKRSRMDDAAESIMAVLDRTAGSEVSVAIENLPAMPTSARCCKVGDCPADFLYIRGLLPKERVLTVFDCGHAVLEKSEDEAIELAASMGPAVVSTHIHSNSGYDDEHGPVDAIALGRFAKLWSLVVELISRGAIALLESYSLQESALSLASIQTILGSAPRCDANREVPS